MHAWKPVKEYLESTTFNRKRKTKDPCLGCGLHRTLCLCSEIPLLHLKTKVVLIAHRKELKRTTNTGQLALKALTNSELRIRGTLDKEALDLSDLLTSNYETILFYPSADAVELNGELIKKILKPVQLLVPDGNWRQASKVFSRHPELHHMLKVKISTPNMAKLHLRAEHTADGMATLQAIALALGLLEGSYVESELLKLYDLKLKKTLVGRGKLLNLS